MKWAALLLLLLCTGCGCDCEPCNPERLNMVLRGFAAAEVDTVILKAYSKSGLLTDSIWQRTAESSPGSGLFSLEGPVLYNDTIVQRCEVILPVDTFVVTDLRFQTDRCCGCGRDEGPPWYHLTGYSLDGVPHQGIPYHRTYVQIVR